MNAKIFEEVYKSNLERLINLLEKQLSDEKSKYTHTNFSDDEIRIQAFKTFRLNLAQQLSENLKSNL